MGCGCKGNNPPQQRVEAQVAPIQVQAVPMDKPNYTIEQIIRIKDYLSATNKQDSERQFIVQILQDNFGDLIPDYCDQVCLKHISSRIATMEQTLISYEQSKTNQ